jgi:hypothetical protein
MRRLGFGGLETAAVLGWADAERADEGAPHGLRPPPDGSNDEYPTFSATPGGRPVRVRLIRLGQAATAGWSVPQYLHLEAAAGRSLDRQ